MPGDRETTVKTYNRSAKELAEYFRGYGSRIRDIDNAFHLAGDPAAPFVLEIGCGDGRDSLDIERRAGRYIGFDISEGMVNLAREYAPEAKFEVGDAVSFAYPPDLDIVFAFASLLHLDQTEVKKVIESVAASLRQGGIFFISLKYSPIYEETVKEDRFGLRQFYLYNPAIIEELAGNQFQTVHTDRDKKGSSEWFQIALRKL